MSLSIFEINKELRDLKKNNKNTKTQRAPCGCPFVPLNKGETIFFLSFLSDYSSLFTFVFAKAAEAVTNMFNHKEQTFEMTGMFDGRVPLYADEAVTADFKTSQFPAMCAANYLKFTQDEADSLAGNDPLLLLFEALKWCFRLSCHHAVTIVELSH